MLHGVQRDIYAEAIVSAWSMPACLALARDHEPWPGGESRDARFEPSPCRRASGFAWPVVKSLLQPCGFRRPPRHECGPRPHTNTPASQAARIWGSVISFAAIAKFLLDRIYRIIRIMKSPKTLARCKNLVNPVNPV